MSIIHVENLKFSYDGKRKILDGISFDIEKGEFVGITGDSGCGKSTLCHILSGIIPDAVGGFVSGNVTVSGKLLSECRLRDLSETTGFVMQDSDRQIISSTVEDELSFGPENMCIEPGEIRKRVMDISELLGITQLLSENPNNLSGGQKQLCCIGSVLTLDPEILILDEPFSHLDEEAKEVLKSIIMKLKAAGKTVLVVEHDHEAIEDADRKICLKDGKIEREY